VSDLLQEIRDRVHGYWTGAPVPEDENPKHRLVRLTCELAKAKGLTEAELNEWALLQQGEPTVAVVNANALQELQSRLNRPGGAVRSKARLVRDRKRASP
jgi:hypothetical protein